MARYAVSQSDGTNFVEEVDPKFAPGTADTMPPVFTLSKDNASEFLTASFLRNGTIFYQDLRLEAGASWSSPRNASGSILAGSYHAAATSQCYRSVWAVQTILFGLNGWIERSHTGPLSNLTLYNPVIGNAPDIATDGSGLFVTVALGYYNSTTTVMASGMCLIEGITLD